jgi:hypothetical protein
MEKLIEFRKLLRRDRVLSLAMIRRLNKSLNIPPEVLPSRSEHGSVRHNCQVGLIAVAGLTQT